MITRGRGIEKWSIFDFIICEKRSIFDYGEKSLTSNENIFTIENLQRRSCHKFYLLLFFGSPQISLT